MRFALALFALSLLAAGCAPDPAPTAPDAPMTDADTPAAPPASAFDWAGWMDRAEPVLAATDTLTGPGMLGLETLSDSLVQAGRALAAELVPAYDWRAACFTPEEIADGLVDTTSVDWWRAQHITTGQLRRYPLGDEAALLQIGCPYGAYQGPAVLLHVRDGEARMLAQPSRGGQPPALTFPDNVAVNAEAGTLTTLALARGLGDCGTRSVYRLDPTAEAGVTLTEVRERDCSGDPEAAPPPAAWPVVFPDSVV